MIDTVSVHATMLMMFGAAVLSGSDHGAKSGAGRVASQIADYFKIIFLLLTSLSFVLLNPVTAAQIPVRFPEGRTRGFLLLRDLQNNVLASGDLSQSVKGDRVTTELVFRFKDGSIHDETTVFSQRRTFHVLMYHLVQKGPAFKQQTDTSFNVSTGQVTTRLIDERGKEKTATENIKIPSDVANGLVNSLLADIDPKAPKTMVSMVVATPKPRIVKLEITSMGQDSFSVGGSTYKATLYNIKINIGGFSGIVAPLIGKQPPDTRVWMADGKVPGLVRSEGPLYENGPVWRIELAGPEPRQPDSRQDR